MQSPCWCPSRVRSDDRRRLVRALRERTRSSVLCRPGYPLRALRSLLERALHQSRRMHGVEARSGGALTLVKSAAELDAYVARRAACLRRPGGCPFTAGLLVR